MRFFEPRLQRDALAKETPMDGNPIHVGIVGAGPRGTVMLERLCANVRELAPGVPVHVHVVDPETTGAGRVWRTDQTRLLVMNTVASDVTVFTDPTVRCEGPLVAGPTQYEWARLVATGEIPADERTRAEAARLEPWSYASRALQGEYLHWAFEHIVATAPPEVRVFTHRTRALALDDRSDGRQELRLEGRAAPLVVDAVVLAVGHYDVAPSRGQQALAAFARSHGLRYVPPASPAEVDLSDLRADEPVVLRGLGLNFYDFVTLLSVGRGGRFEEEGERLVYRPSGAEPTIVAGSGRGVPYMARAEIRQAKVDRYQPRFLDAAAIGRLRAQAGAGTLDFRQHLWPLIAKEAGWVYYRHLVAARGDGAALADFEAAYAAAEWDSPAMRALIEAACPDPAERWDWLAVDHPTAGLRFADRDDYARWIARRLAADYADSQRGPEACARKALSSIMRDLRDEIRQVISYRGLRGASYREHVDGWFSGLNNYVASGPPSSRVRELAALVEAGVVRFVGPAMKVEPDEAAGCFRVFSPAVGGEPLRARVLIEAHLPPSDLRRVTDPLLSRLWRAGGCRPHVIPDAGGAGYETGGIDIEEGTHRVIDAAGVPHPGRYSYGPPVESVQWVTAIGARPHVNSRTLLQGDAIARLCLRAGQEHRRADGAARPAPGVPAGRPVLAPT
jgi:FAD-NAD(P)-binding